MIGGSQARIYGVQALQSLALWIFLSPSTSRFQLLRKRSGFQGGWITKLCFRRCPTSAASGFCHAGYDPLLLSFSNILLGSRIGIVLGPLVFEIRWTETTKTILRCSRQAKRRVPIFYLGAPKFEANFCWDGIDYLSLSIAQLPIPEIYVIASDSPANTAVSVA